MRDTAFWSLVCRKDVNPHPQRCSTVNSDICTHHECHFTAGRGHFGLLSAVPRRVHLPQGHASPHKGSDIDQGISADTTGAPAILLEDSRPQAILKFHHPSSLDYRARHGLPDKHLGLKLTINEKITFFCHIAIKLDQYCYLMSGQ